MLTGRHFTRDALPAVATHPHRAPPGVLTHAGADVLLPVGVRVRGDDVEGVEPVG